jgi:hypothetical protein
MKNLIKNNSLLTVLVLNLVLRIFTDGSLYLFTLPLTIPISILIYYLINVYRDKNKNITVDKSLKETEKPPLNQIPFNKPRTLRILISTSAAILILFTLSFFNFWVDLLDAKGFLGGLNLMLFSLILFPFLTYFIYRILPKNISPKLTPLQVALLITFIIIVLFLLLLVFYSD